MYNKSEQKPLVDPWAMQRTLMVASNQTTPSSPELNKGVLLYAALNLEEGRETLAGLVKALNRLVTDPAIDTVTAGTLRTISNHLADADNVMKDHSLAVRNQLKGLPDSFRAELTESEVIEMTDGTTDLMVTNSGFALSLGLDGAACYNNVATSNLSKRDDSGVINKTPDGKWIKDPKNFVEPDLRAVVYPHKYPPKVARGNS